MVNGFGVPSFPGGLPPRFWQTPLGAETPGLMNGLAGIGYGLLRLGAPERVLLGDFGLAKEMGAGSSLTISGNLIGTHVSLEEVERAHILGVLQQVAWHQGRAASILGISSKTLYRKIREYGIERPT